MAVRDLREEKTQKEMLARKGECKYCHSMRIVNSEEEMTQQDLDRIASEECDCEGANLARKKEESMTRAFEWVENIFKPKPEALSVMHAAIIAVSEAVIKRMSMKIGKNTYTVTMNNDGEIRISNVFKDEDTTEF